MIQMESDQDVHLGRDYEDDIGEGEGSLGAEHIRGVPTDPVGKVEARTRGSDYENKPGRVRIGGAEELQLDRVDLDGGGRSSGGGEGSDWQANMASKGMTAVDGTGYVADTRGDRSYTGQHDSIDDQTHAELQGAGLRLGLNSVDVAKAAIAIASSAYIASKERWRTASDEYKRYTYAKRRWKRRRRDWETKRSESISRKSGTIFRRWQKDRSAADPAWIYADPAEIERMDAIDSRSSYAMAVTWRMNTDEKAMQSFIVKYMAEVEGVKPDSIRARMKKQNHLRDLAALITITDCIACGVISAEGFDREELLADAGGELFDMGSAITDQQRREHLINGAHDFYSSGNLMPPYVWSPISEQLGEVVEILASAGIDMVAPEEEIDWSRV